jgi:hypothetical protein
MSHSDSGVCRTVKRGENQVEYIVTKVCTMAQILQKRIKEKLLTYIRMKKYWTTAYKLIQYQGKVIPLYFED